MHDNESLLSQKGKKAKIENKYWHANKTYIVNQFCFFNFRLRIIFFIPIDKI